jgi:hypothetical protein
LAGMVPRGWREGIDIAMIPADGGFGLSVEGFAQVAELWVQGANQGELFLTAPPFDLLFAGDCVSDIPVRLKKHKASDAILLREAGSEFLLVLGDATLKMVCDARVKDAGGAAKDVDMVDGHDREFWHGRRKDVTRRKGYWGSIW